MRHTICHKHPPTSAAREQTAATHKQSPANHEAQPRTKLTNELQSLTNENYPQIHHSRLQTKRSHERNTATNKAQPLTNEAATSSPHTVLVGEMPTRPAAHISARVPRGILRRSPVVVIAAAGCATDFFVSLSCQLYRSFEYTHWQTQLVGSRRLRSLTCCAAKTECVGCERIQMKPCWRMLEIVSSV